MVEHQMREMKGPKIKFVVEIKLSDAGTSELQKTSTLKPSECLPQVVTQLLSIR
jgi:hypothetical protein